MNYRAIGLIVLIAISLLAVTDAQVSLYTLSLDKVYLGFLSSISFSFQLTFTTSWGKRAFNSIVEMNDICKNPIDTLQFLNDFVKMQITKLRGCTQHNNGPMSSLE